MKSKAKNGFLISIKMLFELYMAKYVLMAVNNLHEESKKRNLPSCSHYDTNSYMIRTLLM
jgi:hypothetical protein